MMKRNMMKVAVILGALLLGVVWAEANDYADLVERVMPSMLMIQTETTTGSGFFVSTEGDILTNFHVIKEAGTIAVTLHNGGILKATLKNYDSTRDMALLKVNAPRPVKYLKISGNLPRQGEEVIAISNPRGLSGTVTNGIVSAFRDNNSWVQFTAPVSPGSSGGALLNLNGEVVGMITGNWKEEGQNLNFAIAPSLLANFISRVGEGTVFFLARNGTPKQLKEARKKGANFNVTRKAYDYEADEERYAEIFEFGETPLHIAAMYNRNAGSMNFLVSQGLDVNAMASSGNTIMETPLSCAIKSRNISAVKELLKAGADPHIWSTGNNGSAFHIVASEYRNYSEAKAVINELVKAGGNVNFHDELKREEINEWCSYEQQEYLKVKWKPSAPFGNLIDNLSHMARDNFLSSFTPLMYAVLYDNPDAVNILLDAGADPNIRNLEGKTALNYASDMPATTAIKRTATFNRLKSATK